MYVKECLDTNWVSSVGPFVDRFEHMVADFLGSKYAVATVNGTSALHVALLVAGIEPDDEVLVSTLSFIAPANAIRYVQAWPIFIDSEPIYWQMDPQKVEEFLEQQCRWRDGVLYNHYTGRRVKGILPVHHLGHPVDIDPILELACKYHLVVIEDGAEGLGALYHGQSVGHLGDIACFSFNGNKIVTSGGGGMIVTDNEEWARRAKYLTMQAKNDAPEPTHGEIGFNYRLSNLHAALGCAQLEQLNQKIEAKRTIAEVYSEGLAHVDGITLMPEASWALSTYWMYTVLVQEEEFGMDSRMLQRHLKEAGVETRPLWQPIHLSPAHAQSCINKAGVAEKIYSRGLSLPCSVGLEIDDIHNVIDEISSLGSRSEKR